MKIKETANSLFKEGNFVEAENKYSECLDLAADVKVFYTTECFFSKVKRIGEGLHCNQTTIKGN